MKTFKQFIKENYTSLTEQNPPFYPATPAGESLRSKALVPNNPTTSGSTKSGTGGTGGTGPNRPPFSAPYRDRSEEPRLNSSHMSESRMPSSA